jgi:transposase
MGIQSEQWLEILQAPERHRLTVTEVCRRYRISRKSYYSRLARYRAQGEAGLAPRSRRPKSSPGRSPSDVEAAVVRIRLNRPQWGARRIRTELTRHGPDHVPAVSTVHAILRRHGLVGVRPEYPALDDRWHLDVVQITLADSKVWIVSVLDPHLAAASRVCAHATAVVARECVETVVRTHDQPRQTEPPPLLPRHAFHRAFEEWLLERPLARTLEELQAQLDEFRWHYNLDRPRGAHRAPSTDVDTAAGPRTLRVTSHGAISYRKRKIQVGARLVGETVHTFETNGTVRVYHGEALVRELQLGPKGTYHGNGKKPTGRPLRNARDS